MLKPSSMAKVVAASVILSASSAVLAGDAYMGASIGFADYDEKWQDLDLSDEVIAVDSTLTTVNIRVGKEISPYFAAEVRLGAGLGHDQIDVDGIETIAEMSVREIYGAYIRGGYPVAEGYFPYLVVGYTQSTFKAELYGLEAKGELGGVSFGVGLDIDVGSDITANFEYMDYFDTVGVQVTGFTLGVAKSF